MDMSELQQKIKKRQLKQTNEEEVSSTGSPEPPKKVAPVAPLRHVAVSEMASPTEEEKSPVTKESKEFGHFSYRNTAWQSNNSRRSFHGSKVAKPPVPTRRPQTVLSTASPMEEEFPPPPPPHELASYSSPASPQGSPLVEGGRGPSYRYSRLHLYMHGMPYGCVRNWAEREQMQYVIERFDHIKEIFEANGTTGVVLAY